MTPPADALARYGFLADREGRRERGRRIARSLADFGGLDVAEATILDVGCSAGLIAIELAFQTRFVIGVDPDIGSIRTAVELRGDGDRVAFAVAKGEQLPFADATFDAAVCNHVYEHAGDPYALMREVRRVLRPGGICYAATGHTLQLVEPHHRLPLLSMLPRPLADICMRATGKGARYEERFLPPWRLRSLFAGFASAVLVSPDMLRDPVRYGFTSLAAMPWPLRALLRVIAGPAARAAPTWIWIVRRDGDQ